MVRPQLSKILIFSKGCWGSKLLNSCLVVSPSNYLWKEYNNFLDSKFIFMIKDFKIFPLILLRQLDLGIYIVGLTAILCSLQRKNLTFL